MKELVCHRETLLKRRDDLKDEIATSPKGLLAMTVVDGDGVIFLGRKIYGF
jgi:hypothetical protein